MTPAFEHYRRISGISSDKHREPIYLRTLSDTPNDYGTDAPMISEGTLILVEFGFDQGLYGRADGGDGSTFKVKVDADDFHKLAFVADDETAA